MVLPMTAARRTFPGSTRQRATRCRSRCRSRTSLRSGGSGWSCSGSERQTRRSASRQARTSPRPVRTACARRHLARAGKASRGRTASPDDRLGHPQVEIRRATLGDVGWRASSRSARCDVWRASSHVPHFSTNRFRLISEMSCSFKRLSEVVLLSICTTRAFGLTITLPHWVQSFRQRSVSS